MRSERDTDWMDGQDERKQVIRKTLKFQIHKDNKFTFLGGWWVFLTVPEHLALD